MRTAELADYLAPLVRDLFIETNPVPMKAALAAMGLVREDVRLPLVALEPANRERLLATLREAGLVRSPRGEDSETTLLEDDLASAVALKDGLR